MAEATLVKGKLCIDDPNNEIFMQGNQNSAFLNQNNSYFVIEILYCNNL